MSRANEQKLIRKAAGGDRTAAAELIRLHQGGVYNYILRMSGRPEISEDIVQEAFVRVLTNLDRFDYKYRFSTWLFTIARRLYLNAIAKHRPAYDTDFVRASVSADAGPSQHVTEHERHGTYRDTIQDALDELSPVQREVLVLFYQLDWSIALIADQLGMPEGTIKSHLHRGRRRMREIIESQGVTLAGFHEVLA